ncbi:hypothetical protein JOQ06_021241, partial [Pogonophryne albipinna]
SRLQQEDRACLMKLPVEPSAMFGQEASVLLRQAQEARRCTREYLPYLWPLPGWV